MTHDPMRQTDIQRRLANMAKALRCGAKTRGGHPCRQAAVRGRGRCRMRNFKHGLWTRESLEMRETMRAKVREIRGYAHARP
jgi:hypothetical protein